MGINRAANLVHGKRQQRRRRNRDFAQKQNLLIAENHKNLLDSRAVFETDEGRTRAGATASPDLFFVFIFFETADRHPAVCRSLRRIGRQRDVRESAFNARAEAERVTVAKKGNGATLARFSLPAPNRVPVSDGRAADGGVTAGENWMKKEKLTSLPPAGPCF